MSVFVHVIDHEADSVGHWRQWDPTHVADDRAELKALKDLGVKLVPVTLPSSLPISAIKSVLDVECAAAFDDLPRQGVADGYGAYWANTFRAGQFVTAVEYLRAMRLRTLLMQQTAEVMKTVDLYVCAAGADLTLTNLTGHPTVCVPNGLQAFAGVDMPTAHVHRPAVRRVGSAGRGEGVSGRDRLPLQTPAVGKGRLSGASFQLAVRWHIGLG